MEAQDLHISTSPYQPLRMERRSTSCFDWWTVSPHHRTSSEPAALLWSSSNGMIGCDHRWPPTAPVAFPGRSETVNGKPAVQHCDWEVQATVKAARASTFDCLRAVRSSRWCCCQNNE